MRRRGTHRPTVEDVIETSGVEILHPGGVEMTRRTAEVAGLRQGMRILDVSSGRGTQSIYYAREYGAHVTGIDLSPSMVRDARSRAEAAGLGDKVLFRQADSQDIPFEDSTFDAVINECAVGIPEDSQKVLDEMYRVARPGGRVVIHESTWRTALSKEEKDDFSERYGTTPLELDEWLSMLKNAGLVRIGQEFERWSSPENFWKIRLDRDVPSPSRVLTPLEKTRTLWRLWGEYGFRGVRKAFENEKAFFRAVLGGRLGYCLFWGDRPVPGEDLSGEA
jgi:SAM-dependent methyltransferase